MRKKIILGSHAPGLGDWSLYTKLAKGFDDLDYDVFISTLPCPGHDSAFRNDEIRQLWWEMNPFIKGFVEKEPTVRNLFQDLRYIKRAKQIGPIPAVEDLYGIELSGDLLPSLFYTPKLREEYKNVTICDPTSVSQPMSAAVYREFANWAIRWHDLGPNFLILTSRFSNLHPELIVDPSVQVHQVRDIFEYADILFSAKGTLMTEAGGHILSATLRKTGTFSCTTTMAFNDRIFVFPEDRVKYYITGQLTPDFHYYPKEVLAVVK